MCQENRLRTSSSRRLLVFLVPLLLAVFCAALPPCGHAAGRNAASGVTAIPAAERAALIALYNSTYGDGWNDNSNWKAEPLEADGFGLIGTEGTWYGVTVDSTPTVTSIDLSSNYLSGYLTSQIKALTGLTYLDLSDNEISGWIHSDLKSLVNLTYFSLATNKFSGPIPADFKSLTALTVLDLSGNELTGSIPTDLKELVSLEELYLAYNNLTGGIPAELKYMEKLRILSLANNELGGTIPADIKFLTALEKLVLYSCGLTGSIPAEIGDLTLLENVLLDSNELDGKIPAEMGNLTALRSLDLGYNKLSGEIPPEMGALADLTYLWINGNQLSGEIPPELGNLTNLKLLHLNDNQLSETIPGELGNITGLTSLYLNGNMLAGPVPLNLTGLTALDPSGTDFGYNLLYSTDSTVTDFLNLKDPDWASTQTVKPTDVSATGIGGTTILVSWTPIAYAADDGRYRVSVATTTGGPYTLAGSTADKTASSLSVTGLTPGTPYFFVVTAQTDAHEKNANVLESEESDEATASTLAKILITGTITSGGSPLEDVLMSGLPGSPLTNASGVYAGMVDVGWSGTVTPTLYAYTFTPSNRTYSGVVADQLADDYVVAMVTQTIEVVSPNGGETWLTGTTHPITWTQTGLTGLATIDLYKGASKVKTLGTPDVTDGTFDWVIDSGETAGTDYRIRVFQGTVSDYSNATFTIGTSVVKVDFNSDGQEDILWRYYGSGGYIRAWFLGNTGGGSPLLAEADTQMEAITSGASGRLSKRALSDPRDLGTIAGRKEGTQAEDVMGVANRRAAALTAVDDPRKAGGSSSETSPLSISDPRQANFMLGPKAAAPAAPAQAAATYGLLGGADIMPVTDLSWQIVGTGDFNGDAHVDILWRYNGAGGYNVVWYMDGTDWDGSAELIPVSDLSWKIVGTGDFNNDGYVDILWRYYGTGGYNVIWYMNGVNWIGSAELLPVTDLSWKIVGTGDFNKDGSVDVLWRYMGAGGYNVVWYMDGADWTGTAELLSVSDTSWEIAGTGDYNNDASMDILWRYNGAGGINVIWRMTGAAWSSSVELLAVADLLWTIVSR